jgi:hypothetical protein
MVPRHHGGVASQSDRGGAVRHPYSVVLTTPEDFLLDLLDLAPRLVIVTLQEQADSHKREPKTLSGLLAVLARSGVPGFADEVWRLVN